MHYVITNGDKLLDSSPAAYTPAQLQRLADDANVGVYVIHGERTGQSAEPQSELDALRVIAIDGATIWAIAVADDTHGWLLLYRSTVGQKFEMVGDNLSGIPADCPETVADKFWNWHD